VLIASLDLQAHLSSAPPSLLVVDGFMGSGKSTLASEFGLALGASVVHCDRFVVRKGAQAPYIECLDLSALKVALARTGEEGRTAVVEGVCIRDITAMLSLSPTLHVYVKRISAAGLWNDGYDFEDYIAGQSDSPRQPELSIMEYHARVRPHEQADFIVHRLEAEGAA
jgi:hypothetical protein